LKISAPAHLGAAFTSLSATLKPTGKVAQVRIGGDENGQMLQILAVSD
jgi:hypothetical protein